MQKCAQNVQKCAQTSFFGPILAKKRIFDPRQKFFLLFSFQKWIPLEKLDIKHVLYDFLHAISIIFKGVKKKMCQSPLVITLETAVTRTRIKRNSVTKSRRSKTKTVLKSVHF